MTSEMMRPCTLWGYTFDAMSVTDVLSTENYIVVGFEDNTNFTSPFYIIQSQRYLQEAITAIYNALNAPVLATEEVLAGLPKDAKVWVVVDEGDRKAQYKATYKYMRYDTDPIWEYTPYDCSVCEDDGYEYPHEVYTDSGCYLVADKDDPKTADYLRQFTIDGVRRVGV